jgi:hypothetical protein
MKSQSAPLE